MKDMAYRNSGIGLLLAAAFSASAMAQGGVITDGNARFEFNNSLTPGSADFQPDGGTDHLFQNWWWFRVDGAPSETRMTWFPTSQSYVGNVASLGASEALFDWRLRVQLTDGGAPGEALIGQAMTLTNTSNGPLRVSLFNYADFDVSGTFSGDSAILAAANLIRITDGITGDFAEFQGVGASAWAVQSFAGLRTLLDDGAITNFSNTGLPFGPGDWTGAFQWRLSIPVGGSVTVFEFLSVNMAVPAPGAALLLGLGGLVATRRRRA